MPLCYPIRTVNEQHVAVKPEINNNKEKEVWVIKGCNSGVPGGSVG